MDTALNVQFLNQRQEVFGHTLLSVGKSTFTDIDVKVISEIASLVNASGIILTHNQPASNLQPSLQEIKRIRKIKKAIKVMNIELVDYIIITDNRQCSFASIGLL